MRPLGETQLSDKVKTDLRHLIEASSKLYDFINAL